MKTVWRLFVIGLIALVIYFATIGRDVFYGLFDFVMEIIQMVAGNYLKK